MNRPKGVDDVRKRATRHFEKPAQADSPSLTGSLITALGAKLGAMLYALVWTAVDSSGTGSLRARSEWTPLDTRGHGLDIYGSGGWVFESPRARY
ncbi:MAG TPA: hypothetical protein VMS99_09535 [Acidimicrobiia bacterium]|nr:hypothetical protein [Acidimicrobiia bacterium]